MSSPSQSKDLRCLAGTTLKGQIESNIQSFTNDTIDYLKSSIISCYFERDQSIRKTISTIINSFIKHWGISSWPELIQLIEGNLDRKEGNEMSIKTINLILEDSSSIQEESFKKTLNTLLDKIIAILQNNNECLSYITTLKLYLENRQDLAFDKMRDIIPILKQKSNLTDSQIRQKIGECWNIIIHLDKEYLIESYEDLINFYLGNFNDHNYEQSFTCASFFEYLILSKEGFLDKSYIKSFLQTKLTLLIPNLIHNMKLTENDMNYLDNKFQNETVNQGSSSNSNSNSGGDSNGSSGSNNSNSDNNDSDNEDETTKSGSGNSNNSNNNNYNPQVTLRKCCSRVLDTLSNIFPKETFSILRIILENDIQSTDDRIKECSILAFGAISRGSYSQVKNHLKTLIPFLIRELQHPNKYVRAIACWTLSRYSQYIMVDNNSENKNSLFKEYLTEILIKFLDKENMVRESAGSAFQEMIMINPRLIEPYLFDVFKIITNVFDRYTGLNLLSIYDILILLMEEYSSTFQNKNFVEDLVKCIVQKWYELVKGNDLLTLPAFFEVIAALIRVSGEFLVNYCDYFLTGSLKIIEQNVNEFRNNTNSIANIDRDLLTKSIDLISNLIQYYPFYIKNSVVKVNIIDFLFEIMKHKDLYIFHYAIALFGDLIRIDPIIFEKRAEMLMNILLPLIDLKTEKNENPSEKLSVCNNSIWTIGLIGLHYPNKIINYADNIMNKINVILKATKLKKSLAQNISICIGRLSLASPNKISKYMENFLKPFCISLRNVKDSPEKRDAFRGICKAISFNPKATFTSFNFFCDSLCLYDNPPKDIEDLFQNIIRSFNMTFHERFLENVNDFPPKLKARMIKRFNLILTE